MKIETLTKDLSASPQLEIADMAAVRDAGFRSILCARPDGEGEHQPTFASIAAAAAPHDLAARYVPIPKSGASKDELAAFAAAYAALPKPVLGYCASGRRITAAAAASDLS